MMMRKLLLTATISCFLVLTISGCAEPLQDLLPQRLQDITPLREEIIDEYKDADVQVTLHNVNSVVISFINSHFNDLTETEKAAKAEEIAQFVKDNYDSVDKIDDIVVSFVVHKKYFLLFEYTNSLDTFTFKISELD